MTPITIENRTLLMVNEIPDVFTCSDCYLQKEHDGVGRCVRVKPHSGIPFFADPDSTNTNSHLLFCINDARDIVFINDTPEDIARYVAKRLEQA